MTSFYFYDLETSGLRGGIDRIMQFAGQRTDQNFKPISEPDNILVKLSDDILPNPSAILFTGLSIKENKEKGTPEPEFAKYFSEKVAIEGTIFIGFNNIRFDDEFIRNMLYRNFYDAYTWHWSLNRSRWDLLDAVRMTRSLRPDGINWPSNEEFKPSNRLESLTKANNLLHEKAHDALSDVFATIEVAKLIAVKQPKLFNYLLNIRDKKLSNKVIDSNTPFVYTSGRYSTDQLQTSLVLTMDFNSSSSAAQVYDLRVDPEPLLNMSVNELIEKWRYGPEKPREDMPLKTIKLNRCPAVAPLSVLDKPSIKRLKIDVDKIKKHEQILKSHKTEFNQKLKEVISGLNAERDSRQQSFMSFADQKLYSGFISPNDQKLLPNARQIPPLPSVNFTDKRLNELYFIYLARNFSDQLIEKQKEDWKEMVNKRLFSGESSPFTRYTSDLAELKKTNKKSKLIIELEELASTIEADYGKP